MPAQLLGFAEAARSRGPVPVRRRRFAQRSDRRRVAPGRQSLCRRAHLEPIITGGLGDHRPPLGALGVILRVHLENHAIWPEQFYRDIDPALLDRDLQVLPVGEMNPVCVRLATRQFALARRALLERGYARLNFWRLRESAPE